MWAVTTTDSVAECYAVKKEVYTDSTYTTLFTSNWILTGSLTPGWDWSTATKVDTLWTQSIVLYV